jgi:hypothetical protein
MGRDDGDIDAFIADFGTHYRKCGIFGGAYGADYYFNGYGTEKEKLRALAHVKHADINKCLEARPKLYTPDFSGFGLDTVQCYGWSLGGNSRVLSESGIDAWMQTVATRPTMVKECLVTMTDLLELAGVEGIILSRFAERVDTLSQYHLKSNYYCYFKPCPVGKVCMGNICVGAPQEPRWPDAVAFCLPKPMDSACPSNYGEFHAPSWVYGDTENGKSDEVYVSGDMITTYAMPEEHAPAELMSSNNGGIKMYFCCQKQPEKQETVWPKGTYCIYATKYVSVKYDPAWHFISIVWNDEDDNNANDFYRPPVWDEKKSFARVPLGMYDNYSSYTEQTLLCRSDGPQETPIVLPRSYPFYLVRFQDKCQMVAGMQYTSIEVTWDTETDHNSKEVVRWNHLGKIPRSCGDVCESECRKFPYYIPEGFCYVGYDKIAMNFCYYEQYVTPSPTPAPNHKP